MAGQAEKIKEYLVSLGFVVDDKSYKKACAQVQGFGGMAGATLGRFSQIGKVAVQGGAMVVSAFAAVASGAAALAKGAAEADIQTEKFARRMWLTESAARSLNGTLEAMGESMDSLGDIALNPELRRQFMQLRSFADSLDGNGDIDKAMTKIRAVTFEYKRLQLIGSYATRYIAYYLTQYLAKPMEQLRMKLKSFNDKAPEILNKWGRRIGWALSLVMRLGITLGRVISDLITSFNSLPGKVKAAAVTIGILGAVMASPWLAIAAVITGVLLLLDDFYSYKDGKKSLLGGLWSELDQLYSKISEGAGAVDWTSFDTITGILRDFVDILEHGYNIAVKLIEIFNEHGGFQKLFGILNGLVDSILSPIKGILDAISEILAQVDAVLNDGKPIKEAAMDAAKGASEKFESGGGAKTLIKSLPQQDEIQEFLRSNPWMITLPAAANNPAQTYTTNRTDKKTTVNQDNRVDCKVTLNVHGQTNGEQLATSAGRSIKTLLNKSAQGWQSARIDLSGMVE